MKVCNPLTGMWNEVSGTTLTAILDEMDIKNTHNWSFKVNGEVRKSLGSVSEDDVIELVDTTDVETVQPNQMPESSGDNK